MPVSELTNSSQKSQTLQEWFSSMLTFGDSIECWECIYARKEGGKEGGQEGRRACTMLVGESGWFGGNADRGQTHLLDHNIPAKCQLSWKVRFKPLKIMSNIVLVQLAKFSHHDKGWGLLKKLGCNKFKLTYQTKPLMGFLKDLLAGSLRGQQWCQTLYDPSSSKLGEGDDCGITSRSMR